MRSKFKWIFTLLVALTMQFSFAQEKTVTGVVSDATGPLPGVNVVVKGTTRGTQTDSNGKYAIKVNQGDVLVISFIGMKDSQVIVGVANTINVKLQDTSVDLKEVVIDGGYTKTTKKKSNVATATITAKGIEGRPNVSFLQSLQSQVSGLNIATSSGSPGSAKIDVIIRGLSSANGNTEPLVVIDGIPANQATFRGINSEDIESASILKDAGATAIYGNRGANGVIVIKTKKGSFGSKLTFRYTMTSGFTTLQDNSYSITNSKQILGLENTMGVGLGATLTQSEIDAWTINTNWKDYFFRTGTSTNHNLSFTMGTEKMTNFTSIGYFNQQGIVPNTDFQRFSIRSNFTGRSTNDKFTYTTNFSGVYSKRSQLDQETRTDINSNVLQNPLQGLLTSLPYLDPNVYVSGQQLFNDFGAPSFQITPYMLMDYLRPGNIPSSFNETKLLVNSSATYKFNKELSFSTTGGMDFAQNNRLFARAPQSYLAIVATPTGAEFGGVETQSTDKDFGFNLVNKLNYTKTFKEKHSLDVSVFVEYNKAHRSFFSYTQTGLDPRTWALGAGTGYIPFNTSTPTFYRPAVSALKRDAGLFSYFTAIDYDYDSRFGFGATVRRDASYKFISDNTWGTFWSVSGRWNIDRESFMANSIFEELKLRGSYGTTGNQNIIAGAYGTNPLYLGNNLVRDLNSSQSGYGNAASIGVANIGNDKLRWETTTQANIGIDFNIKNRLTGTIDIYRKKTTDLFDSNYTSAVTSQYSFSSNTQASLINKGVELLLKYDVFKKGNVKLELFVNGSYNKNEYADLVYAPGDELIQVANDYANQNGHQLLEYYVVPYVGVNPANGNLQFLDINNNITETPTNADRRLNGKSAIPVYQGGFGFNSSYKGFFVNTQFSFVAKVSRFDYDLSNLSNPTQIGSFPVMTDLLNAWTPTNTSSDVPSLTATNLDAADTFSDKFLVDASYVRLRNLSIGYNVPSAFLQKTFIKNCKFYGQLENYFTWSKWKGFDVEGLNSSNQGGYPTPKVASFGIDLQF